MSLLTGDENEFMDRRNFFKLVGTASGGVITGACGKPGEQIIPLLVPEQAIVPGVEEWHPSVCRECSASCGTIVRVMEAERKIEVEGETVRQPIAAIKKIEGNPLDPVSGGRLCARGQAAVQSLYHPDRLAGPRKRSGERGAGEFEVVTWDEAAAAAKDVLAGAVAEDPSRIVYLSRPGTGTRAVTAARFLDAIGAPPASTLGIADLTVERKAAEIAFGWQGAPVYEIQDATFVLSIGADFLGGWASPVFYSRRFGHMRRGRPGLRGRLVHAESRFSQTAWSADQWLPVQPGGELALALAIGHVLVTEGLAAGADSVPRAVRESFASVDLERAVSWCGIESKQILELARALAEASAPLVVAGASIVQSNSLDALVAGLLLNVLLDNVGEEGGVKAPSQESLPDLAAASPAHANLVERLKSAEVVLLDGADPVYQWPAARDALADVPTVISFSSFLDDSSAYADWILPDHDALESSAAVSPAVAPGASLTGARAFARPLHDTRATEDLLADLAQQLERPIEIETPARAFRRVFEARKPDDFSSGEEFAEYAERQGGWWSDLHATTLATATPAPAVSEAEFAGDSSEFPLHFQPYFSPQFGDGAGARLPWLQELPDPASSAMWGLPVEIDPGTAARLGVANGNAVRVISPRGEFEAPAYIHPAAIPGVVSMAIGQGHENFGRYAAKRGANPLSIVAEVYEAGTGVPALGATRVRLEKGQSQQRLVQYAYMDREPHPHRH